MHCFPNDKSIAMYMGFTMMESGNNCLNQIPAEYRFLAKNHGVTMWMFTHGPGASLDLIVEWSVRPKSSK